MRDGTEIGFGPRAATHARICRHRGHRDIVGRRGAKTSGVAEIVKLDALLLVQ